VYQTITLLHENGGRDSTEKWVVGLVANRRIVVVEGFLMDILNHLGSLQAPLLGGLQCHKMQQFLRFSLYPTSVFTMRKFYWEHSQSQGSISSLSIHSQL
jgi:hypothetical protein